MMQKITHKHPKLNQTRRGEAFDRSTHERTVGDACPYNGATHKHPKLYQTRRDRRPRRSAFPDQQRNTLQTRRGESRIARDPRSTVKKRPHVTRPEGKRKVHCCIHGSGLLNTNYFPPQMRRSILKQQIFARFGAACKQAAPVALAMTSKDQSREKGHRDLDAESTIATQRQTKSPLLYTRQWTS